MTMSSALPPIPLASSSRHQARPGQKAFGRRGHLEAEFTEELDLEHRLQLVADFGGGHRRWARGAFFVRVAAEHEESRAGSRQSLERPDEPGLVDPPGGVIAAAVEHKIERRH